MNEREACHESQITTLVSRIVALEEEVRISDRLLAECNKILDAYPCPAHGQCIPYVMHLLSLATHRPSQNSQGNHVEIPLGGVQQTSRGFELIEFIDASGKECSLQMSSLAEREKPGTSAVWLGEIKAGHPRMQLNREQVAALIGHLHNWLTNDTFMLPRKEDEHARHRNRSEHT